MNTKRTDPITHPSQLSQLLKGRRKRLGLTQAQLAAKLTLTQNRLSQIETDPRGLTLDRLLDLLNVLGLEMKVEDRPVGTKSEW